MRTRLRLVFFLACFGALFSSVGLGQGIGDRNRAGNSEGRYTIQGRVYLPDGRPAQNVKVDIDNTDGAKSYYTNLDGTFQTGSITAGNYTISVTIPGLETEREFLTIAREAAPGQTYNVSLFLRTQGQKKGDFYSSNPLFSDVPKAALDKFKKGAEKLDKNDAKAAVVLFDEAIGAYPGFFIAYHHKGLALLKENELDKALEAFVKAIELKSDYVETKYLFGYTHYLKKNYEVAAAVFDDVLKQRADMIDAQLYQGISLFYLKNTDAAEALLKKAIATPVGEKMPLAHLYLGQIFARKKRNAEAVVELEKYLELLPKAPNADRIKTAITDLKKQS